MTRESIDKEIRELDREIVELQQTRPAPALKAERGDATDLAALDARIEKLRRRKTTLEDARVAAVWEAKRSLENECVPFIKRGLAEWRTIRSALSGLETGLRQFGETRKEVQALMRRGVRMTGLPTADLAVLSAVIEALGLDKHALPFLGDEIVALKDEEATFTAILDEFSRRGKSSPRAVRKFKPEDQPQGYLPALSGATRVGERRS